MHNLRTLHTAQFIVHIRRENVVSLQNVGSPDHWLRIYNNDLNGQVSKGGKEGGREGGREGGKEGRKEGEKCTNTQLYRCIIYVCVPAYILLYTTFTLGNRSMEQF